jgi:hypothetical protein
LSQQIRFCKSFDGTRIAYAINGDGPLLVRSPHWLTHLEYEWQSPIWRPWIEAGLYAEPPRFAALRAIFRIRALTPITA